MALGMVMRLQFRRLYYFVTIAECESFSRAALRLNVAQPALTHHMRELEKDLGLCLLNRAARGTTLTHAGKLLFEHASRILFDVDRAEKEMEAYRQQQAHSEQVIRLSVISSLATVLTPRLLAAARQRLPGARLHIAENPARKSSAMVRQGSTDLSVTLVAECNKNANILIWEELFYVEACSGSELCGAAIPLDEAFGQDLILPSQNSSMLGPFLETITRQNGLKLRSRIEIDGLNPRKEAVVAGLGATILPRIVIESELQAGLLTARPMTPKVLRPIVLEVRSGFNPGMAKVLQEMLVSILEGVTHARAPTDGDDIGL